jgi:tRNA-specific 2-thiouridylase
MSAKVVIAMSGGVDSSVAAYLLKEQGFDVTGLFMSLGTCLERLAPKRKACCSTFDANDARKVADIIGIEFSVLDFKKEFEDLIKYFCSEYDKGRTPNPCVRCNQYLKFGHLWTHSKKLGADYIATGHYARIELVNSTRYLLKKGIDSSKDQSYMLSALTQEQLAHILLPLGTYPKTEIRAIARKLKLPVMDKPDSQEICFVPSDGLTKFLKSQMPDRIKKGEILNMSGKLVGTHPGYQLFTIGQRHIGIALGKPVYVVKIVPETNTIIVGDKKDVYSKSCIVDEVNWIGIERLNLGETLNASVKIRYLHKPAEATITPAFSIHNSSFSIQFTEPQMAITPGQAAVFYQDDIVLGGGWIRSTELSQLH